jgi:hypothetical protein
MGKGVLRFSQALIQPFRQTLFEVRFSFPAQHGVHPPFRQAPVMGVFAVFQDLLNGIPLSVTAFL